LHELHELILILQLLPLKYLLRSRPPVAARLTAEEEIRRFDGCGWIMFHALSDPSSCSSVASSEGECNTSTPPPTEGWS
jgi:hypothetical protein